jgi:uncharacterized repeat protein (TIGR03843 family)
MSSSEWLSTLTDILSHLSLGTLTVSGRLVDASNATLFAQCEFEESVLDVIYKPVAGERPLWDFPDGSLAHRELAAYLVSTLSQWDVVPPTVLRDGPFGIGMVQQWVEVDDSVDLSLFYREDNPILRTMALFDAVINNTDRKIGHLLPTKDGKVFGCDHGVTFHEDDKLRTVLWQWAGMELTARELTQLEHLKSSLNENPEKIAGLLTESEISALYNRIERLTSDRTFPIPSEDWPAVPWPPF